MRIDDIEAVKITVEVVRVENTMKIQNLQKDRRDKIIKKLRNRGLSIRQMARLTGISFSIIRRI